MTEQLQPAAIDRLRVAIENLLPAVERLVAGVNALYELERIRSWGEGLALGKTHPEGTPSTETFAPLPEEAYAPVKAAILKHAAKHGQKAVLELLARFGVKSGLELKPAQYEAVLKAFA